VVLYTVGQAATIPVVGQNIPVDFPLAMNPGDTQGLVEKYRCRESGGSWGIRFLFVDFPVARLVGGVATGNATAILVDIDKSTGEILAISSDTF
jgi:hypothetical protein